MESLAAGLASLDRHGHILESNQDPNTVRRLDSTAANGDGIR